MSKQAMNGAGETLSEKVLQHGGENKTVDNGRLEATSDVRVQGVDEDSVIDGVEPVYAAKAKVLNRAVSVGNAWRDVERG